MPKSFVNWGRNQRCTPKHWHQPQVEAELVDIIRKARASESVVRVVGAGHSWTDAVLTKAQAKRLATAAHDGIARAVVPSHLPNDGDLLFAISTGDREIPDAEVSQIGHVAALCVARAIARAVFAATPAPGDLLPCWSEATG